MADGTVSNTMTWTPADGHKIIVPSGHGMVVCSCGFAGPPPEQIERSLDPVKLYQEAWDDHIAGMVQRGSAWFDVDAVNPYPEPSVNPCGRSDCQFATELFAAAATRADNEIARRDAIIASQAAALNEWRRKSDEDAGRLKRYHAALFEIAHGVQQPSREGGWGWVEILQDRARRELEDEVCPRPH